MEPELKLSDILNHHLSGGEFEYQSTNFKEAKAEYEQSEEWKSLCAANDSFCPQPYILKDVRDISDEIRKKHSYWRKGKLRSVHFTLTGAISKVFIGARYSITVWDNDTSRVRLIKKS